MRRMVGAAVVVAVLGLPHLVAVCERSAPVVAPAPPIAATPAPSPVANSSTAPPLPRRAPFPHADIIASFRADPLHFLSTAPADSLDLLPGIGPVLASRIAGARAARGGFTSWDDVLEVRGIGPRTVERLQAVAAGR